MRAELKAGHAGREGRTLGRDAQATVAEAAVAAHWLEKSSYVLDYYGHCTCGPESMGKFKCP